MLLAVVVKRLGYELLAGSGFTSDENVAATRGRLRHLHEAGKEFGIAPHQPFPFKQDLIRILYGVLAELQQTLQNEIEIVLAFNGF